MDLIGDFAYFAGLQNPWDSVLKRVATVVTVGLRNKTIFLCKWPKWVWSNLGIKKSLL